MVAEAMWGGWVAGLTENKTKPSSLGLAELGNVLFCFINFYFMFHITFSDMFSGWLISPNEVNNNLGVKKAETRQSVVDTIL